MVQKSGTAIGANYQSEGVLEDYQEYGAEDPETVQIEEEGYTESDNLQHPHNN